MQNHMIGGSLLPSSISNQRERKDQVHILKLKSGKKMNYFQLSGTK